MQPPPGGGRDRFPVDPATQRWGLGEVGAGILASIALSTFVGGLIVAIAGWTGSSGDAPVPVWGLAVLQIPLWAGYLGATVYATRDRGSGLVRDLGAASTVLDAPVGLVIGVATQLVVLPLVYVPILELTGSSTDELSAPARELAGRAGSTPGWILFGLVVGLGAPLVEELFYRGLFLRALRKRGVSTAGAVVISSAVFAAIHLQALQFAGLFVFGVVAALLTVRSGRLGPAIWAHVGFNLTTVVVLYLDLNG